MLKQHLVGFGSSSGNTADGDDAVIRFDAASTVRAIVYHVVDERLAKLVSADSIRRTVERLAGREFSPSIVRGAWTAMTNPQRLQWLLDQSGTLTVVGEDDSVSLRARRAR